MEEKDVKVGDVVDGLFLISICGNLLMCEGITPFDRGEEEEEGCSVGPLKEVEEWEHYEQEADRE